MKFLYIFCVEFQESNEELVKSKKISEKHRLQLLEKEREFNETEAYGKEISEKIRTMINTGGIYKISLFFHFLYNFVFLGVNPKVHYRGIGRGLCTKIFVKKQKLKLFLGDHTKNQYSNW